MNRASKPITFVSKEDLDSSFLSEFEVYEIRKTLDFVTECLETSNNWKANGTFSKEAEMMFTQGLHSQKLLKESSRKERMMNGIQFFQRSCLKQSKKQPSSIKNLEEELLPIKIASPFKKKAQALAESNTTLKSKVFSELLNFNEGNREKSGIRINDNIKNIVLSNISMQLQNSDQEKKIFPANNSKMSKFQKTHKIFEEIKQESPIFS